MYKRIYSLFFSHALADISLKDKWFLYNIRNEENENNLVQILVFHNHAFNYYTESQYSRLNTSFMILKLLNLLNNPNIQPKQLHIHKIMFTLLCGLWSKCDKLHSNDYLFVPILSLSIYSHNESVADLPSLGP